MDWLFTNIILPMCKKGTEKMDYIIENSIEPLEYNKIRNSIGWDSKDEILIEEALKSLNKLILQIIQLISQVLITLLYCFYNCI